MGFNSFLIRIVAYQDDKSRRALHYKWAHRRVQKTSCNSIMYWVAIAYETKSASRPKFSTVRVLPLFLPRQWTTIFLLSRWIAETGPIWSSTFFERQSKFKSQINIDSSQPPLINQSSLTARALIQWSCPWRTVSQA